MQHALFGSKTVEDFDGPNDMAIEFVEFVGGYPILFVNSCPSSLHLVAIEERLFDVKYEHVADSAVFRVPIAHDLRGVLAIHDWIKDRLLGKTRRKGLPICSSNQFEFDLSRWSKED